MEATSSLYDAAGARDAIGFPWPVLVISANPTLYHVLEETIQSLQFEQRPLQCHYVSNRQAALTQLQTRRDWALIFLDIGNQENANNEGLQLLWYIRKQQGNRWSRLVLYRDGPLTELPTQLLEDYEIDDYCQRQALNTHTLPLLLRTQLRHYHHLCTLQRHYIGLEQLVAAISNLSEINSLDTLAAAVLDQLSTLINSHYPPLNFQRFAAYTVARLDGQYHILASTAQGAGVLPGDRSLSSLPLSLRPVIEQAFLQQRTGFENDHYLSYSRSPRGSEVVLSLSAFEHFHTREGRLLDLFARNLALTYENLLLAQERLASQQELLELLSNAVEGRSQETGAHVTRVARYSALLAQLSGAGTSWVEQIRLAAPLHDIGKIAISDTILYKPGPLDAEEWTVMKTHAERGAELLSRSQKPILQMAALIAREHHERWDGSGYPYGLKGETISLAGRIVALADVLDALISDRCYKAAWSQAQALDYIRYQRGGHFDPRLVDLLLANLDRFMAIQRESLEYQAPSRLA